MTYLGDPSNSLEKLGLRIMRVANDRVLENLEGVAEAILRAAGGSRGDP